EAGDAVVTGQGIPSLAE
ncbi:MAG: hypothetical protein ACOVQM_06685, partial [Pirellula sp.]